MKPWLLLLPNFVCRKQYYEPAINPPPSGGTEDGGAPRSSPRQPPLFLIPDPLKPYRYWAPGRAGFEARGAAKGTTPFETFWYVHMGGVANHDEVRAWWLKKFAPHSTCRLPAPTEALPQQQRLQKRPNPRARKIRNEALRREGGGGGGEEAATNEEVARKSVSQERTFAPTSDRAELERKIADAAKNVAASLEQEGLLARVATVKMKRATFEVTQRQASLERSHARAETALVDAALRLFRAEKDVGALRLVGVKASGLVWAAPERRLARSQRRVDAAMDDAAGRRRRRALGDDDEGYSGEPDDPEGARATYACACGRTVAEADRAEHEDWHFALALKRNLETESALQAEQGEKNEKKRRRGPPETKRIRGRDAARDRKQKTLFDAFEKIEKSDRRTP